MSKWRYTCTLSAPMISPPRDSARASASSLLPDAVGPTTTATSASPRSTSPAADFALQLIPADSRHDGPAVRAVTRKIHLIERDEQRRRLFGREPIARAHRPVARHRGEHQIDRV